MARKASQQSTMPPKRRSRKGRVTAYPVPRTTESTAPPNHQLPTPEKSSPPSPHLHPRAATPPAKAPALSESSSELSSIPDTIGSTPEGLLSQRLHQALPQFKTGSPVRRSQRARKRSFKAIETEPSEPTPKKRKVLDTDDREVFSSVEEPAQNESREIATTSSSRLSSNARASVTPYRKQTIGEEVVDGGSAPTVCENETQVDEQNPSTETHDVPKPRHDENKTKKVFAKKLTKAELAAERPFYQELAKEVVSYKAWGNKDSKKTWTQFNRSKVIMYGSDAQTQYTPAYAGSAGSAGSTSRGGKHNGRGGARGGRGGAGNNRGRSSRGRAKGRDEKGRDEDSPEPPQPKKVQTQEDAAIIKYAKARQAELRRFFNIVGSQQAEILDTISARDLSRLAKKPKAHKQVPEYEEILDILDYTKTTIQDKVRKANDIAVEAEQQRFEAEKVAIENRCKTKISDLHGEYQKGAQGDLIIFRRAITAAHDETRTQDGSEADYFPHYHDFPEPDQNVRGYTSSRITDEKPFKHHLLTYDDQARREVIDDDVGPIIQAFAQKNAERRAEEERKKTQTMEALSEEAERQLKEIKGYLIPRPMVKTEDVNSYALSCLADVSEWMAQQYPNKQYIYMPLENGDTFPREALNYDRLPGQNVQVPQPPPVSEIPLPSQRSSVAKPSPLSATHGTRRSLRNLQPNGPLSQPQSQPPTPIAVTPGPATPATPTASGPTLAPAPPKLAPAPLGSQLQQSQQPPHRPPPIETRALNPTPPERSPVHPLPSQTPGQSVHGLPALQPRQMSQSSLPPPPPGYGYPQQYSPTHPPQPYPPHHHTIPPPYLSMPGPSPYHPQHSVPPSPYTQQHAHPPPYHPYGPPPYYAPPAPPQQYSFMPPQQGPAPSQASPIARQHSDAHGSATPLQSPRQGQPPTQDPYQNGYHHNRNLSHPFQSQPPPVPPPQAQPPPPPIHLTSTPKSRARSKAKQPVTFVNQTLATRKAAAEQLAKEEAAAAAERKDKMKGVDGKGRKLAPKP